MEDTCVTIVMVGLYDCHDSDGFHDGHVFFPQGFYRIYPHCIGVASFFRSDSIA